mmetsp:Transcript_21855/g.39700  ORF Transcript_21855/g.39700 Transcript_21855/m.39700 type:complete len:734 (+) Transcript_21855:34-2235(+)
MGQRCCRRSDSSSQGKKNSLLEEGEEEEDPEKGQEVGKKDKKAKKDKKDKKKKKAKDDSRFLDSMPREEMQSYLQETYEELAENNVINMQDLLWIYPGYPRWEIREMFAKMYPDLVFEEDMSADEADYPLAEEAESAKDRKNTKKKKMKEPLKKKEKDREKDKDKERDTEKAVSKKDGSKSKKAASKTEEDKEKDKSKKAVSKKEDKLKGAPAIDKSKAGKEDKSKAGKEGKPKAAPAIGIGKEEKSKEDLVLKVKVISGRDLRDADWGGQSDPFAVVQVFNPDGKSKFKGQTPVIDETLNPVWNSVFPVEFSFGDILSFRVFDKDSMGTNLLGEYVMDHEWFYPFGFEGEVLLEDGHAADKDDESYLKLKIDVKKDRTGGDAGGSGSAMGDYTNGQFQGPSLNFEDNGDSWKVAHDAVNNAYEDDPDFDPVETTGTALNTIVRLAESGVHIPDAALAKVMRCLKSGDRRYRISALLICRALGKRMIPYQRELLEAFHDPDEGVRAAAIKVFASWNEDANDFVIDIAKMTEDRMYEPRHAALETLAELCQSDCMQALVVIGHTLSSPDPQYRLVTVKILFTLGIKATPQAFALAQMITEDDSPEVRAECCKVLSNLGLGANTVQDAIAALYKAEKDYDAGVRAAADQALKRLREEGRDLPRRPRPWGSQDSSHSRAPEKGGKGTSSSPRDARDRDRNRDRPGSARKGGTTRIGRDMERTREASTRRERPASRK